jgi:hypothetical protein
MAESGSVARETFNHLAWIGPVVAVFGLLSYFTIFSMWPLFRDFPWLNLLILAIGVGASALALPRARGALGRAAGRAGLLLSVSMLGLLCFYAFHLSYQLPDAGRVAGDGTKIPEITLASYDGTPVDIAAAANDKLILVFYRGHW